jgi:hypothetical protein
VPRSPSVRPFLAEEKSLSHRLRRPSRALPRIAGLPFSGCLQGEGLMWPSAVAEIEPAGECIVRLFRRAAWTDESAVHSQDKPIRMECCLG